MKRLLKPFLIVFIIFFVVAASGICYLKYVFLPITAKAFIEKTFKQQTGRDISIGTIDYRIFKGIVIENITIKDLGQKELLRVKEIYLNALFLPFVKAKKIIVPFIYINNPVISIVRNADGRFNFSDILDKLNASRRAKTESGFSLYTYKINILNASILFKDLSGGQEFSTKLSNLDIVAGLALPAKINCRISGFLDNAQINATATYDFSSRNIKSRINLTGIDVNSYAGYLAPNLKFKILSARLNLTCDIQSDLRKQLTGDLRGNFERLFINFPFFTAKGGFGFNANVSYPLEGSGNLSYDAKVKLDTISLTDVKYVRTIHSINGDISIKPDLISCQGLNGFVFGFPVTFAGEYKNFKAPTLELSAQANVDLAQLKKNLPETLLEKFKGFNATGAAFCQAKWSKDFGAPGIGDFSTDINLQNCQLTSPYQISNAWGKLNVKKDIIKATDVKLVFNEMDFLVNGTLEDFNSPHVKANVKGKELDMDIDAISDNPDIKIQALRAKFGKSSFDIIGDIINVKDPIVHLYGNSTLDLSDLGSIFAKAKDRLSKLKLSGSVDLSVFFDGKPKDRSTWELGLKSNSGNISVYGLNLGSPVIDFKMANQKFSLDKFQLQPYDGLISAIGSYDLSLKNPPYSINLEFSDINLRKVMRDTKWKDKDITGILSGKINLDGFANNIDTMKGTAWFEATDGKLWEMPFLGKLAAVLLTPGLTKVVFTEAHGDFNIANRYIVTQNLSFISDKVGLTFKGNMDFDTNIDAVVNTMFAEGFLQETKQISQILSLAFSEAGKFVGEIKVKGTITDPKFIFAALPIEKIFKDKVIEVIKLLFKKKKD